MEQEPLESLLEEFMEQEHIVRLEGETGVRNLCKIVRALGYKDELHFGQFRGGSYGDLLRFLEDNSGAVEAILDWVNKQDLPEWREEVATYLPEKKEE